MKEGAFEGPLRCYRIAHETSFAANDAARPRQGRAHEAKDFARRALTRHSRDPTYTLALQTMPRARLAAITGVGL